MVAIEASGNHPVPEGLNRTGDHHRSGGVVHVALMVGGKKDDDWEQINKELHLTVVASH